MIKGSLKKLAYTSAIALTVAAGPALANTATITAEVEVLNNITVTELQSLDFGQIGITTDTGQTPDILLQTDGTFTPTFAGAASIVEIGGSAPAQVQLVSAAGAAVSGVDINFVISNPVDLTDGVSDVFTLSDFEYDDQQGNTGAVALSTPVTVTLDTNGEAIVLVGGRITAADAGTYADGVYTGSFDVQVYY